MSDKASTGSGMIFAGVLLLVGGLFGTAAAQIIIGPFGIAVGLVLVVWGYSHRDQARRGVE